MPFATWGAASPIPTACTYRDTEVDYDHPLRYVIGGLQPADVARIRLGRLSVDAVAVLVEGIDVDLAEVMSMTGGNPLFATEIAASPGEGVPVSVRDAVLARTARLSDQARETLQLVSVVPTGASRPMLESIADTTADDLAECGRFGLVDVGETRVAFRHELTRRAVDSALDPARRRRLHAAVLGYLANESDSADPARLAHHAHQADDAAAIVRYVPQAARAAMAESSDGEATAHFRALEPHLDLVPMSERAALLTDWATAEFRVDLGEAHRIWAMVVDLCRSQNDEPALARALTSAVRTALNRAGPQKAEALMREAAALYERLPPGPDRAFHMSERAWLAMMEGQPRRAVALAREAVEYAEQVGDELAAIEVMDTMGVAMVWMGDSGGLSFLQKAAERARAGGYRGAESRALHNLSSLSWRSRDMNTAMEYARRHYEMVTQFDWAHDEAIARAEIGMNLVRLGEWDAAEDLISELLSSSTVLGPFVPLLEKALAVIAMRRGRPALSTLRGAWSCLFSFDQLHNALPAAAALLEWMWLNNEPDKEQVVAFKEILDQALDLFVFDAGEMALWLWELGELRKAPAGIAEPYQLMIEGEALEAARIWEEKGCPYEQAIALSHGDHASQLEALEILDGLGASAVATKLRQTMRDRGQPVPRGKAQSTRHHPVGLTARQAEVLDLLAEGMTNLEIADELFLSPRTVEHHVSAILSKLDVTTRHDAVAAATDQGLVTISA